MDVNEGRAPEGDAPPAQKTRRGRHPNDCQCAKCDARRAKPAAEKARIAVKAGEFAQQLKGVHMLIAQFFPEPARPIIALRDEEATQLANAVKGVMKHYDIGGMVDSKYFALGNLAICAGMIYIPRVVVIGQLAAQARKSQKPNTAADIVSGVEMPTDSKIDFGPQN